MTVIQQTQDADYDAFPFRYRIFVVKHLFYNPFIQLLCFIIIHTKIMFNLARKNRTQLFVLFVCLTQMLIIIANSSCTVGANDKPLLSGEAKLIREVKNGQKMIFGDLNDRQGNYIYVANLKGTSYQMGKAFGQLFKNQLSKQLDAFYDYYFTMLDETINQNKKIPDFLKKIMVQGTPFGLKRILDLNVAITKQYTNPKYIEQMKGIQAGSQIKSEQIARLNIFPELIKAACTVAGLWGKATSNGQTLHMRALDWDSANPINKYPVITVYHPTEEGVNKHANFGWVGFIGILTGMSEKITIGQKVWLPPKHSVKMTRYGNPWTYVLRDVISTAKSMNQALAMLTQAKRTCAIHLGVGSLDDHSFRMFQYSQKILNNYDDSNYTHYTPAHPKKQGVAYFDKHVQPSGDSCVGSILVNSEYYKKWQAESFWRILGFSHQTGDTQLVVFDLQAQNVYISYSRNYLENEVLKTEKAYYRSPILIQMNQLWKQF